MAQPVLIRANRIRKVFHNINWYRRDIFFRIFIILKMTKGSYHDYPFNGF